MKYSARLRRAAAASVATVSLWLPGTAGAATPKPAPRPAPAPAAPSSLIPARVGASASYHYDANETGPQGTTSTRAVVTLTRVVNDRVTVTVTPDDAAPAASVVRIAADGSLAIEGGADRVARAAANAGGSDIPLDRPLGGLPGDTRGGQAGGAAPSNGGGGYGANAGAASYGTGGAVRPARPALPESVRVMVALVAARGAAGANAKAWPFTAGVGSSGAVPMTAHLGEPHGGELTVVADGSGETRLPSSDARVPEERRRDRPRRRGRSARRCRRAARRRRLLPQRRPEWHRPGRRSGGGVYGGGRRRGGQGGQGGGAQGAGGYAQQQGAPATVTLHVESTFRNGRLVLAHGSDATVAHASGADATTTVRWTLTAL